MNSDESNLFINEFLMGLTAHEYVNRGIVTKLLAELKVNRTSANE